MVFEALLRAGVVVDAYQRRVVIVLPLDLGLALRVCVLDLTVWVYHVPELSCGASSRMCNAFLGEIHFLTIFF